MTDTNKKNKGEHSAPKRFKDRNKPREIWDYLKATVKEFGSHKPFRLGAVVACFAILALAGLLVILRLYDSVFWSGHDPRVC